MLSSGLFRLSDVNFVPKATATKPRIDPQNSPHYSIFVQLKEADEKDFEVMFESETDDEEEEEEDDDDNEEEEEEETKTPAAQASTASPRA
jgi:hypothetical protein